MNFQPRGISDQTLSGTGSYLSEVEAAADQLGSYQCWWAGSGVTLHARVVDGVLEIAREELEEGVPDGVMGMAVIRRFTLTSGATVSVAAQP